jgi:CRP-like cAMP-binding protein
MWDSLIKNLSRHVSLTGEEVQTITSCFRHRKFRKRQYILQQGDVSRNETYIVSGLTRTYEVDDKGQEHVVQFGPEDWWVGDMYSYLTDTPSQFNIDCMEDTEVLQISKANQEMLYREVPKLERHFRIMIQNAYVSSLKRISSNLSKSAAERYDEFLTRYPCIGQRVPNHQIASYLGITPQSLSRVRRKAASF